jgi:hypothetical protein
MYSQVNALREYISLKKASNIEFEARLSIDYLFSTG